MKTLKVSTTARKAVEEIYNYYNDAGEFIEVKRGFRDGSIVIEKYEFDSTPTSVDGKFNANEYDCCRV